MRKRGSKAWLLGFCGLVTAACVLVITVVWAQPFAVVEGQPVNVSADQLVVDVAKGTATMTGSVRVRRGDLTVRCERVEARYDGVPNVTWAKATGSVVAEVRDLRATAGEAELHMNKHVIELRGGVRLTRGGAWMEAREAQIDFKTGRVTMEQVKGAIPVPSSAIPKSSADAGP